MTEREKMLAGKIYDPFCEGMPEERARAHMLCQRYNAIPESDTAARNALIDELIPRHGKNLYLQGPIQFDFGSNISFGDDSYANFNFTVIDICKVDIGSRVFIGPNVSILTALHPLCYQDRNQYFNEKTGVMTDREYAAPVTIGDDCWIAGNVTVLAGVKIGRGCVIGAGSVVTRDIPDGCLAFGNPCRVRREITEADRLSNHPELFSES